MSDESIQAAQSQLLADHQTKADCATAVQAAQGLVSAANDALTFALNAESNAKAAVDNSAKALQGEIMSTAAAAAAATLAASQSAASQANSPIPGS
jgi:hypothetical protein